MKHKKHDETETPLSTEHLASKENTDSQDSIHHTKKDHSGTIKIPINSKRDINRIVILGLLALVTFAIFPLAKIFFVPIAIAATFATLFNPFYTMLLRFFRKNKAIAAFATCLILFICLIVPTYVVFHLMIRQMIDLYQTAGPVISTIIEKGTKNEFLLRLQALPFVQSLPLSRINWPDLLNGSIKTITSFGSGLLNKTSTGMLLLVANVFVIFFTMFYFFMDGERLISRIKRILPIRDDYKETIVKRFLLISRATVFGTVIIGITQGTLGAITLLVFGIKSWFMWGVIMTIFAIIPAAGSFVILVSAGIIQIITGNVPQGIAIIAISALVISNIDNIMRPRLVGHGAKLHDLIIFFSSLGGIIVFGVMGFIIGPMIAALFVALLDIYENEFKHQLDQ